MSRNYTYNHYFKLLDEVNQRYDKVRAGHTYEFETEIEPFLENSVKIIEDIHHVDTDFRFTEPSKQQMIAIFEELIMSCHAERMSLRIFREQTKYINIWLKHIEDNRL